MSTIIRVASPAALLSLVPRLLDCTPRRSLVLIPFAESRSLAALRSDLPAHDSPELDSIASTLIGMACKVPLTDALTIVVYSDDAVSGLDVLPHRAFVDAVLERAHICGLHVIDALVVADDGWRSYLDPALGGDQPLPGVPVTPDLPDISVEHDQVAAAALPAVDLATSERVTRILGDVDRVLARPHDGPPTTARRRTADEVLRELADPPVLFEDILRPSVGALEPHRLAGLAFALERPLLRDVALMQWVGDISAGDAAFHAQTRFADGEWFPEELARPMWGEGARPDPDRLHAALERCRLAAAAVPPARRPGALAACAWLAWATGRSSHAAFYATAALDIDASHGLGRIVLALADNGRLPEWLFERPAQGARSSAT